MYTKCKITSIAFAKNGISLPWQHNSACVLSQFNQIQNTLITLPPRFSHTILYGHSLIRFALSFIHSFIHSLALSLIHSSLESLTRSVSGSFIHSFARSLIHSFLYSLPRSLSRSFIHSLSHSKTPARGPRALSRIQGWHSKCLYSKLTLSDGRPLWLSWLPK